MLIQGSLFEDLYIPDSILAECKQRLLDIPEVVLVEVDPECDELSDRFVLTVYTAYGVDGDDFNRVYNICKHIQDTVNNRLITEIYFLVELQYE